MAAETEQRLDKFLWFVRLTRTRSLAQATVAAGHCRIDGRAVFRAHAVVRPGNVLTFPLYDRVRVIRVDALPDRRGPAMEARICYTDLDLVAPAGVEKPRDDVDAPDSAT